MGLASHHLFGRASSQSGPISCEYVAHLLRVFGIAASAVGRADATRGTVGIARGRLPRQVAHKVLVLLEPDAETCSSLGVDWRPCERPQGCTFEACAEVRAGALRSFGGYLSMEGRTGKAVVTDGGTGNAWWWCDIGESKVLLVGTRLAEDIMLLRQGDRKKAGDSESATRWGFEFERPNYLFEGLAPEAPSTERLADQWCETLARVLRAFGGVPRQPVLPGDAKGAVIITGDDDQAAISAYRCQLGALAGLPVTYFMHPGTRIDRTARKRLFAGRKVEFGLHPDALEAPRDYASILARQCRWFEEHFGFRASAVRNHGFLNDGYWRHASSWVAAGLNFSSNLPGLNGTVLNGSLLPARLVLGETVLPHWSILTAFGDGMLFALEMTDEEAAQSVCDFAGAMLASEIPGVLVINLHPENAARAPRLHAVMHELGERGFLYWTMGECLAWFARRDNETGNARVPYITERLGACWKRLRSKRDSAGVM